MPVSLTTFQSLRLFIKSNAFVKSTNATYSLPRFLDKYLWINEYNIKALSIVLYLSRNPACDSVILL